MTKEEYIGRYYRSLSKEDLIRQFMREEHRHAVTKGKLDHQYRELQWLEGYDPGGTGPDQGGQVICDGPPEMYQSFEEYEAQEGGPASHVETQRAQGVIGGSYGISYNKGDGDGDDTIFYGEPVFDGCSVCGVLNSVPWEREDEEPMGLRGGKDFGRYGHNPCEEDDEDDEDDEDF